MFDSPLRQPTTRTEWVDDLVREAIITNELAPGSTLVMSRLAKHLGVSVTPLREAIARLAAAGFVELTPHGSARVATVTAEEAREIYELRILLEPVALRQAVSAASPEDHQRWRSSYEATLDGNEPLDRLRRHGAFHRSLISPCPSRWMLRTLIPLQDGAQRIVASIGERKETRHRGPGHHGDLLELALSGDATGAERELAVHLAASLDSFIDLLDSRSGADTEVAP